eukprot:CAMPEP_0201633270 /NCGR_PEP_ID=MMETSP0493-20130528/6636_1 /ASSEMBLY_ACC=CAM_ASM_000838 /TAXON_ID=420259 /ORGANISM="Thalassiosira gravida, Strain GMp14c1" /LENGTH=258 /DNA_ID=CAMNT_0048104949 /DNA_START=21 /DNA_END=797 /DNA_ORIENTATION=+
MKSFLGSCAAMALLVQSVYAFAPSSTTPTIQQSSLSFTSAIQPKSSTTISSQLNARPQTRFRQVQSNILTRRTINEFQPTLPPHWEKSLDAAIEAAIYAPNHKRSEPWRFYLLGPKSIEKVCRLNAEIVASKKGEEAGAKKLKRWMLMPGWLVVTCAKSDTADATDSTTMEDPMGLAREDYAACCCAVQNLCLSLHSQGMGTKWTTGGVNFDDRFGDAVGFDSSEEYTVGTIWFGTPVKSPNAPGKKMGLDTVLRRVE